MSNDKQRDRAGRFIGNKYKKVDGVWYKGRCQDCEKWVTSRTAKRCHKCRLKYDIGKPKYRKSGSQHYNWKGGITPQNRRIRYSNQMYEWRKAVLYRDGYICIQCGSSENIQVDHIKPFSTYPDLRFEVGNGRVLCYNCHRATPTWGKKAIYAN